ncbi:hypothetical protein CP985_03360 [Malaciobacter mytili LMG 24559]|uniref:F-type type IV conjugative transfer system protein TraW n=1 Tax=Malaciobacter mytili LMG 24559 TaxID=1032238 RepID=A0AAX2AHG3_9BACT|nr:hypothetical protein [Malaciobacter mytili]AXH16396.1 F-type type IV conjugative transfer system protein TraW [Malaciobacter mytili LMG 24559]RXK16462.1 hypothetical protein CP985_03360 [Malaciobacter mytili LMG 24559]
MKKLIFLFILVLNLYSFEDLGIIGEVEPIEGKTLMDVLTEKYNKLDKLKLEKDLLNARKESLKLKSNLPTCKETKVREFTPLITLKEDIVVPIENRVLYTKGTYNILDTFSIIFPYHILFIDYDDEIQRLLPNAFGNTSILTLIAKGDINKLVEETDNVQIAREDFEIKSFNIQCLPTIVTQRDNKFIINEYNPEELIEKEQK